MDDLTGMYGRWKHAVVVTEKAGKRFVACVAIEANDTLDTLRDRATSILADYGEGDVYLDSLFCGDGMTQRMVELTRVGYTIV